jgi:hypothetical protein
LDLLKILKKQVLIQKFNSTPPPKKKEQEKKEKKGKKIKIKSFYRPTTWHTFTKRNLFLHVSTSVHGVYQRGWRSVVGVARSDTPSGLKDAHPKDTL